MKVETWNAIANSVYALATAGLAVAAWVGLGAWRRQIRGQSEYDVARRILLLLYRVRNAMKHVRSPSMSAAEYLDRPGRAENPSDVEDLRFAYGARLRPLRQAWEELDVELLEAEALWGRQTLATARADLFARNTELVSAIIDWIHVKQNHGRWPDGTSRDRVYPVVYDMSGPDKEDDFSTRVNRAIEQFESVLRPHLQSGRR